MKYCYQCNRITAGKPLFCNFCGRSYNVKLCPRRHVNPRVAVACRECGSRELSTPQPRVPLWVPVLEFLLRLTPGVLLGILSLLAIAAFLQGLVQNPDALFSLVFLVLALGVLWGMWGKIPQVYRGVIHRMLKRKRGGDDRRSS